MKDIVNEFVEMLLSLNRLSAKQMRDDQIQQMTPIKFIEDVVVVALERIGAGWKEGTISLSQVYMTARICEGLVDELLPPEDPERKDKPNMAICVLSDHHKLGKVIVFSLLRAAGFDVSDFGTMEVDELIDRVNQDKIETLLISVLMLPSALKIKQVKEKITEKGLDVKIIVGGAPFLFDDELWREVGANAMCRTASEVVPVIQKIIGGVI
jgi:methanogenic corrinoid protein MtbC1